MTQAGELGHVRELAVPAPGRVRVDLHQLDLAARVGAEVEARVIAQAEAREQRLAVATQRRLGRVIETGFAETQVRPVWRFGIGLRTVVEQSRQRRVERGVIYFEQRQRREAVAWITDQADTVFVTGEKFLDDDAAARQSIAQFFDVSRRVVPVLYQAARGDADAAVAAVRLDESRKLDLGQRVVALQQDFARHRDGDRLRRRADQRLVVAQGQCGRAVAAVGNAEQLQAGRQMRLERGVVAEPGIAKIQHEFGRMPTQEVQQGGMFVDKFEVEFLEFGERRFQATHLVPIIIGKAATRFARIGQTRITQ